MLWATAEVAEFGSISSWEWAERFKDRDVDGVLEETFKEEEEEKVVGIDAVDTSAKDDEADDVPRLPD